MQFFFFWLSYLFVLSISDLIRCRNVSRVLLSDSLSGLEV